MRRSAWQRVSGREYRSLLEKILEENPNHPNHSIVSSFQLPGGLCFNQREVREINSFSKQYAVPFKLFKLFDGQAIPTGASPICTQRVLKE